MTILKMEAWEDFDMPYDINICAGDNGRIAAICNILNEFCRQLPGLNQDVKLSVYLGELECANVLVSRLVDSAQLDLNRAQAFVNKLIAKCAGSSVYVYANTFSCEDVELI